MKKYFLYVFSFCCFSSMKAISQEADFVIPQNEVVKLKAEDGTTIVATDIYSMKSKLKRSVRLFNPKTNELIGETIIRLESADPEQNMYEQLEKDPDAFTGVLIIEADGITIYKREIQKGEVVGGENYGRQGGPGPVYNPNLSCSVGNIHDCVAYRVEGMNWLQFGLCLLRAPVCYAEQWAYCTYSVCWNHMQYTNPN